MDDKWGGWGFLFLTGIGVAIWWWGFDTLWYAFEYWMPPSAVHIVTRPTDCDFWRAPVGTKACTYERQVYGQLPGGAYYDAQTGRVMSKTGEASDLNPHSQFDSIMILWTKKNDE